MKFSLLLTLLIGLIAGANGQNVKFRKVNGVVNDAGGSPLKNCSVIIFGTHTGVKTDKDGKFSLDLPIYRTVFISIENQKEPAFMVKVATRDTFLNVKLNAATRAISTSYLTEYNKIEALKDASYITIDEPVPTKYVDPHAVYSAVETAPKFKNGDKDWAEYVNANLKYPERDKANKVQGRVIIMMVVERDGSLTDIKVIRGISTDCDNEAVRLLKASPKWNPGMMNGQAVRCSYSIPIKFTLNY